MANVKKRGVCTMTDCSKSHFARGYVEREIERRQIESLQDYKAKTMQDANDDTIS